MPAMTPPAPPNPARSSVQSGFQYRIKSARLKRSAGCVTGCSIGMRRDAARGFDDVAEPAHGPSGGWELFGARSGAVPLLGEVRGRLDSTTGFAPLASKIFSPITTVRLARSEIFSSTGGVNFTPP